MLLRDIMTPNVETVSLETPLSEAARKMASLDVGFLPVIDSDSITGVITDRDIVIRGIAKGLDPTATPVSAVMSEDAETLPEDADVRDAAKLMEARQIRRVLVTGPKGRYVGVVSLGDLAVKADDDTRSGEILEEVSTPSRPAR